MEDLSQGVTVEIVQIEHAEFALHIADVIHDSMGLCLMNRELIIIETELPGSLDKCLHREGVVLCGHGKLYLALGAVNEAFLKHSVLSDYLSGISQEFLTVPGDGDPAVRAKEQGKPKLLLELPDSAGQRRLCDEEPVCRFIHAAAVRYGDCITHLLKSHLYSPFSPCAGPVNAEPRNLMSDIDTSFYRRFHVIIQTFISNVFIPALFW